MKTIDITPTWTAITPVLCRVLESGTYDGVKVATQELMRMAELADRYNHMIKRMGEAAAREYLATYGAADLAESSEGAAPCTD